MNTEFGQLTETERGNYDFDDSDSEDAVEIDLGLSFSWESEDERPSTCAELMIGLVGAGQLVLESVFPNSSLKHVATLTVSKKPKKTWSLVQLMDCQDRCVLMLLCSSSVVSDHCNQITSLLFQHLSPETVTILGDFSVHQFSSQADPNFVPTIPCLRKLECYAPGSTNQSKEGDGVAIDGTPFLESPTMIDNMGASLLTRCSLGAVKNKAQLYVCLLESLYGRPYITPLALTSFAPVLKDLSQRHNLDLQIDERLTLSSIKEMLRKVPEQSVASHNPLYL
eukprot:Lithocolla_globosa_v1_NODE_659_length_3496_cov_10.987504.p2 type:complete len:281 gc:universal NODE_659_length_3496_cov_10.987504:2598-3440(+)